jgi:GR25 family glycosyltransferase involved in LPS biosynthesis
MRAYVINLDRDTDKLATMRAALDATDLRGHWERFQATLGRDPAQRDLVCRACWDWCPASAVGIGVSHRRLARHFLDTTDESVPYALVLEDDALPTGKRDGDLRAALDEVVAQHPADWDVILLYCQGLCPRPEDSSGAPIQFKTGHGSTAAYLMSRRGAAHLAEQCVSWHVDMVRASDRDLNGFVSPTGFFIPDFSLSSTSTGSTVNEKKSGLDPRYWQLRPDGPPLTFFINSRAIRIPGMDVELTWLDVSMLILVFVVVSALVVYGALTMPGRKGRRRRRASRGR